MSSRSIKRNAELTMPGSGNPLFQLFFGLAVQAIHFFTPETRVSVLLDREAKRRRAAGETNVYGPSELEENRFALKKLAVIWFRPFEMFVREPIVLCCSLLSGFSDALIFTFLEAFTPVYSQWGFTTEQLALAFIPYVHFSRRRPFTD